MSDRRALFLILGFILLFLGGIMIIPMLVDLVTGSLNWLAFAAAAGITLFISMTMILANWGKGTTLSLRGGLILTSASWLVMTFFAALPFLFSNKGISFTDAFFESLSGLTTTGATTLTGLDSFPKGLLLWRAVLQWIGGIGIIVTAMAVLPILKIGGMQLFQMESSDASGKVFPRAREIASSILFVYILITLLNIIAYLMVGMTLFDAVCYAMTTISTGGFANTDSAMAYLLDTGADRVSILFMILGALPFTIYLFLLRKNFAHVWRDPQIRFFLFILLSLTLVITLYILVKKVPGADDKALRLAAFNTVSVVTGTGFASADYSLWGPFAQAAFFLAMFIGGCAGSASCSIKIFRYQIAMTALRAYIYKLTHPKAVVPISYAGKNLETSDVYSVLNFIFIYLVCFTISAVLLSALGLDMLTAWSGAATTLANVGPGLGPVIGPSGSFQPLSDVMKWILCINMFIGRLEIMVVLALFSPNFWRN